MEAVFFFLIITLPNRANLKRDRMRLFIYACEWQACLPIYPISCVIYGVDFVFLILGIFLCSWCYLGFPF